MINEQIILSRTCSLCNKQHSIEVSKEAYDNWNNGMNIQNAFPNLSIDERELIITGFCSECFDTALMPIG